MRPLFEDYKKKTRYNFALYTIETITILSQQKTARHWNFKGLFYLILYKRVTFFCVIVTVGLWVQHHLPNPSPVFVKRENKKVAFQTQSSTLTITGAHIATLIRLNNKRFRSSYCTKV